ncbi:MAG TPA: hypothetical protein VFG73_06205 [Rhodanobacteraceae bacterium]|nr:hypothetical protein [Rhodanobacteraceae bacterium]
MIRHNFAKPILLAAAMTFATSGMALAAATDNGASGNAGTVMSHPVGTFASYDDNGDGKITKDEFYGSIADDGIYADWDANHDGLIEQSEWDNDFDWDFTFVTWDVDGDGYVGSGEFYDSLFNSYDINDDGFWENGEWHEYYDAGLYD